mmetsp:Transcript_30213/g.61366  ORF Transcript_30213/g.61366 Transcript_30213/m.61366 type:complete len:201 (-) Transcript_30213:2077-2679(-)
MIHEFLITGSTLSSPPTSQRPTFTNRTSARTIPIPTFPPTSTSSSTLPIPRRWLTWQPSSVYPSKNWRDSTLASAKSMVMVPSTPTSTTRTRMRMSLRAGSMTTRSCSSDTTTSSNKYHQNTNNPKTTTTGSSTRRTTATKPRTARTSAPTTSSTSSGRMIPRNPPLWLASLPPPTRGGLINNEGKGGTMDQVPTPAIMT